MPLTKVVPVPADPAIENKLEDRRLWIGNLDSRVTELHKNELTVVSLSVYWYQLLKLLEKHGRMEKFDLLFHRSGPLAGQPRGYAFVTYGSKKEAEHMMKKMDGKRIGTKHVTVRWAHNVNRDDYEKPKVSLQLPALVGAKHEQKVSRSTKIQAIEAKLKMMESSSSNEFQVNIVPSSSCGGNSQLNRTRQTYKTRSYSKPYSKR